MSNSENTAISAQETNNAQKEKVNHIVGDITQEVINNLKEEIAGILVGVKSDHFKERCTNGNLTVTIPMEEYHTIIGDDVWMYDPPVNINTYDPTPANATSAVWAVREAEWKKKLTDLETFNGACTGEKELIIYGVGEDAVVTIKQRYVGYRGVTPKKIMQHIRDKMCI